MSDLLKEAIADAKAVRETALQNAKMALEEAFTPQLKSMLSAKLKEDEDMEDMGDDELDVDDLEDIPSDEVPVDDMPVDMPADDMPVDDMPVDMPVDDMDGDGVPDDEDAEVEEMMGAALGAAGGSLASQYFGGEGLLGNPAVGAAIGAMAGDAIDDSYQPELNQENYDLNSVIKELEEEIDADGGLVVNETAAQAVPQPPVEEEYEIDEADLDESDEELTAEDISRLYSIANNSMNELAEHKQAVSFLKDKLHEVNILNAKLLYTNKLFKEYSLDNNQKLKVVENFDRAQTTREIKLVYSTIAEQLNENSGVPKRKSIKESASAAIRSTKPSSPEAKKVISEETEVADRFRKLAGLIKG